MKESKLTKSKQAEQASLLNLLRAILPKIAPDAALAEKLYAAAEAELREKNRMNSFEKLCERIPLPDLEPESIEEVKQQLTEKFADAELTFEPNDDGKGLRVDVELPDGTEFHSRIPVRTESEEVSEEQEIKLKFVSFPVAMAGDPELIWSMAKRENMTNEEAGIALNKLEDDFWASKTGQKLIRDRVERSFPEFVSRVPGAALTDLGLKRHYKLPEALKVMRKGK